MNYFAEVVDGYVVSKTTNDMTNQPGWQALPPDLVAEKLILLDSDAKSLRAATEEEFAAYMQKLLVSSESQRMRDRRSILLEESDKLMAVDRWNKFSPNQQQAIASYRQLLRDVPEQTGFPLEIVWPELTLP